jgi:hypothetical protein
MRRICRIPASDPIASAPLGLTFYCQPEPVTLARSLATARQCDRHENFDLNLLSFSEVH